MGGGEARAPRGAFPLRARRRLSASRTLPPLPFLSPEEPPPPGCRRRRRRLSERASLQESGGARRGAGRRGLRRGGPCVPVRGQRRWHRPAWPGLAWPWGSSVSAPSAAPLAGDGGGQSDGLPRGGGRAPRRAAAAAAGRGSSALAGGPGGGPGAGLRGRGRGAALLVPLLLAGLREADHRLDVPAPGRRGAGADLPLPVGRLPGPGGHLPRPSLLGGGRGQARRVHRHRRPDHGGQRDVHLLCEESPRRAAQPPPDGADRHAARCLLPADIGRAALRAGLRPVSRGGGPAAGQDGQEVWGAQQQEEVCLQEVLHRSC